MYHRGLGGIGLLTGLHPQTGFRTAHRLIFHKLLAAFCAPGMSGKPLGARKGRYILVYTGKRLFIIPHIGLLRIYFTPAAG